MSLLIFAILALIIAALIVAAVERIPIAQPFKGLIEALILVLAAIAIAVKAGLV